MILKTQANELPFYKIKNFNDINYLNYFSLLPRYEEYKRGIGAGILAYYSCNSKPKPATRLLQVNKASNPASPGKQSQQPGLSR